MLPSLTISRPWGHLSSLFINLLAQRKDSCCSPCLTFALASFFFSSHSLSLAPLFPLPVTRSPLFLSPLVRALGDVNEKARPPRFPVFPLADVYEGRGGEMMEVE